MFKRMFLAMFLTLAISSLAFADMGDKATLGGRDSSGNYSWRVDSSDNLIPGTTAQNNIGDSTHYVNNAYVTSFHFTNALDSTKVIATTDSITTADSGKDIIVNPITASGGVITLPTATVGQVYTFIDGKTNANTSTFSVNPYGSELIKYSISGVPLTAGQQITSTGQTGDSVTLVCSTTGYWSIKAMHGIWTNGS